MAMTDTQALRLRNYFSKCYTFDEIPSNAAEFLNNNFISKDKALDIFLFDYIFDDEDAKLVNKYFGSSDIYIKETMNANAFRRLLNKQDYPRRFFIGGSPVLRRDLLKMSLNNKKLSTRYTPIEFNLVQGYAKVYALRKIDFKTDPNMFNLLDVKRDNCFIDSTIYFNEPDFLYAAHPKSKKISIGPLTLNFDSKIAYNTILAVLKHIDNIKKYNDTFFDDSVQAEPAYNNYLTQYMDYNGLSDGFIEDVYKRIKDGEKSEFTNEEWELFSSFNRHDFSFSYEKDDSGEGTNNSEKIDHIYVYSNALKDITLKNKVAKDSKTSFDFTDRSILIQDLSNDIKYDFKDSLFSPIAQPDLGRISIGEINFDFDNPFFYNVMLYALKKADENIDDKNNVHNEIKKSITSTEKEKIPAKKKANNSLANKKDKADNKTDENKLKGYFEELDKLVGLTELKSDVKKTINLIKVQKIRKDKGLKTIPISKHLVFTGNPGTGKTTVARILANIYREIGILSKGQLIEVDRADLVGGYIGQTALKTQKKIEEALGGILFIDEAYSLYRVNDNDFGREAIDTLVKAMEDNRDDFVVIAAGYPEQMQQFIDVNPGLKSRFNKYLHFPDYSKEELIEIFNRICKQYEYKTSADAQNKVVEKIERLLANKDKNFANAREIRNMFENIVTKQADRIASSSNENEDYSILTLEDCN